MNTVARRDPLLAELDAMTDSFEQMFGLRAAPGGSRGFLPPVDIWEDENAVVIQLDVPGCRRDDLSAEAVNGQLIVTGERAPRDDNRRRYRTERWQGRFVRAFSLPRGVDGGEIEAEYEDGVLTVRLPKPEQARPKAITISHRQRTDEAG